MKPIRYQLNHKHTDPSHILTYIKAAPMGNEYQTLLHKGLLSTNGFAQKYIRNTIKVKSNHVLHCHCPCQILSARLRNKSKNVSQCIKFQIYYLHPPTTYKIVNVIKNSQISSHSHNNKKQKSTKIPRRSKSVQFNQEATQHN